MLLKDEQDKFYRRIGESIKVARTNSGLNQEELSKHLGFVSRISIANIESGKQKVQLHTLFEIAHFLEVSILDLIPTYETIKKDISAGLLKRLNKEVSKEVEGNSESQEKIRNFIINFSK